MNPHLYLIGLAASQRKRAAPGRTFVAAGVVMVLAGLGLAPKAFAHDGLIYQSSGTCSFSKEPAPCDQYVSPCVKGVEYFYFPAQGVLRTRDNRIVEVAT